MSRILVIGDIHGKSDWKDIIKQRYDKVIFLGDYVSTHEDISEVEQIHNLKEILEFKKFDPDAVVLLRGNHDLDELNYSWAQCSGHFYHVAEYMVSIKDEFLELTQWIYIDEDLKTVFSHAGISTVWMENSNIKDIHNINNLEPSEIFGFTPGGFWDMYGDSVTQPPTWIRPQTLATCNIEDYDQVVGHTPVNGIVNISKSTKKHKNIWLCDALNYKQYLSIVDGEFIVNDY